jgi:hypothetical protein
MLGAARHSQGSGEYFPTTRDIALSWRNMDSGGAVEDNVWREITPISVEGSDYTSVDLDPDWTLAFWFKFVQQSNGIYSNFAQPINTGRFGPQFVGPWVSKTGVGIDNINTEYKTSLATINLQNDTWYSAVFTNRRTPSRLDIWINGQRVYTGANTELSPIYQDDFPTINNDLNRTGIDGSRYADCWISTDFIDFTTDVNKLRFFYDYRIGKPAVSGGLSGQQDDTDLSAGDNIQTRPYPPPYDPPFGWRIGSWYCYPGGINTGSSITPTTATSGMNISFTDTPTT